MKQVLLIPHSRQRGRIWFCVMGILVAILAFCNLASYPRTWFDEGWHLLVARHLARTGQYRFGPAVGPTVFYPVAWMFRLFGVGLLQARLVMVGYLFVALGGFYLLVRQLYDAKVAIVSSVLLVTSNGVGLLNWGRQVLGEVPALAFFLLGALCLFKAIDVGQGRKRLCFVLAAGLLFGFSVLTKNHFVILIPTLVLLGFLDWLYYHQTRLVHVALLIVCILFCVVTWYLALNFVASPEVFRYTIGQWQTAPSRSILLFEPSLMLESVKFVLGTQVFLSWGIPGLVYGGLLALRRNRDGFRTAFVFVFAMLWLAWYVIASIGWERNACPGLAVTAIFVGKLFHDLVSGGGTPLPELWNDLRMGRRLERARRLCFLVVLLVMILYPLSSQVRAMVFRVNRTPQQMAAYINAHVDREAMIETLEPEIGFLTEHAYHYPPSYVSDAANRSATLGDGSLQPIYDFLEADPDYILVGGFGKWTGLYPAESLRQECVLVTSIGVYDLYRLEK